MFKEKEERVGEDSSFRYWFVIWSWKAETTLHYCWGDSLRGDSITDGWLKPILSMSISVTSTSSQSFHSIPGRFHSNQFKTTFTPSSKGMSSLSFGSEGYRHGVTKRCRLSWLTNSALVYEPKCEGSGGVGGVSANELYTEAQIHFGDMGTGQFFKLVNMAPPLVWPKSLWQNPVITTRL